MDDMKVDQIKEFIMRQLYYHGGDFALTLLSTFDECKGNIDQYICKNILTISGVSEECLEALKQLEIEDGKIGMRKTNPWVLLHDSAPIYKLPIVKKFPPRREYKKEHFLPLLLCDKKVHGE
jgi:hypothetical protein